MTAIETDAPAVGGGAPVTLPLTGAEYLESLRDGREVWIYGERVADVTTHPAFRNSARSVARLYDALHDPAQQAMLTSPTDTGNGGFTHSFFRVPRCADDLRSARDAIVGWQRLCYGYMGRTPDYKAAFLGTLGANAPFVGLLGTVIGIVRAFHLLDQSGGKVSSGLMSEVGGALVATAIGIIVALPAVAFFNGFQRVIKTRLSRADALGRELLAQLHTAS